MWDLEDFQELLHRDKAPVLTRVLKRKRTDRMHVIYCGRFLRLACITGPWQSNNGHCVLENL